MNLARALANLNGVQMPLEDVKVSALDRGFLFGDAVYEVLRIYRGKPWLLEAHWQRFAASLQAVRIAGVDLERVKRRMLDTIAAGHFEEALAYIQVTRGVAPRRHVFPPDTPPTEFMYVQEFSDPYVAKRREGVSVITQPDLRWQRCDIKSTNLLGNVLAMQAADEAGCIEALLYLPDGTLTEATHTSFFAVVDGALVMTPGGSAILPGITRQFLVGLAARASVPCREQILRRSDLPKVAELLLTGTTAEVLPIVRVDGCPVGAGRVGPITLRMLEAYQAAVHDFIAGQPGRV
jgi:D-alanine transaminase